MLRLKHIISLLLAFALLAPNVVILEHHHDHFVCHAKNEKHFHVHHEKCLVCSFEFSLYSLGNRAAASLKAEHNSGYNNNYRQDYFLNNLKYSFLLRAPPAFTDTQVL
jgi:hypothetical protein